MATNKIVYNGNTLIDLTGDTVAADKLASGYTAHDRSGTQITGTYEPSVNIDTKTYTPNNNALSWISFSSLQGEPKAFFIFPNPTSNSQMALPKNDGTTYYRVVAVCYDGTDTNWSYARYPTGSSGHSIYSGDARDISFTYSSNTLKVTVSKGRFQGYGRWQLTYIY